MREGKNRKRGVGGKERKKEKNERVIKRDGKGGRERERT